MTLALSDLRTALVKLTGEDSTDLPDASADLLLNQSYWELMDKFPFREKQTSSTFNFVDGTRSYSAPSPFEAVRKIIVVDDNDQHIPLNRKTLDWYEETYDSTSDQEAIPTDYFREGSSFIVWPTPDATYAGIIYYTTVLSDLALDADLPEFPQVWHEILLYGAAWRRFLELGDLVRQSHFRNLQLQLMATTQPVEDKEEEDSRMAGIDLPKELFDI